MQQKQFWEAYKTFLYSTLDVTATRFTARIGQEYFHIHSLQASSNNNNYLNFFIKMESQSIHLQI